MARGRQRADWARTSLLAAIMANPYRDSEEHPDPFKASDFDPFADNRAPRGKRPTLKMRVSCLKVLCKEETTP
jgi:hypothetical protein